MYAWKSEKESICIDGIQKVEFDMVMLFNTTTVNDPMRQQRLANIACYKCGPKGH